VPIYVTETGIADASDTLRPRLIETYYEQARARSAVRKQDRFWLFGCLPPPQVMRALGDGADVRGVFYWTLMDNVEWHEGFKMKFGLYAWCPVVQRTGGELRLRAAGGGALRAQHAAIPSDLEGARRYARSGAWRRTLSEAGAEAGDGGGPEAL